MKRILLAAATAAAVLLALAGCGKRQDTSAIGSVYTAKSYTTNHKTKKTTKAVEMTLYLNRDDNQGVLSTATLAQQPYYRRYETIVEKAGKLTTTGETMASTFATVSDAEADLNPTKYSYSKDGDSRAAGTVTKTAKGLDLKLGKTVWHFTRKEKTTRYLLPYGIAEQAKKVKLDSK